MPRTAGCAALSCPTRFIAVAHSDSWRGPACCAHVALPPQPRAGGGTYFFTVTLRDRSSDLLVTQIEVLRAAVRRVRARAPFHIDAWVVLPDHMHCLWTLPDGDADYPARWWAIKAAFSRALAGKGVPTPGMKRKGERGIWQSRYWEHTIRDARDYAAHMDYTHFNPVKHGHVARAIDWPYSSFRRCVAAGLYPADWQGNGEEPEDTGEATTV